MTPDETRTPSLWNPFGEIEWLRGPLTLGEGLGFGPRGSALRDLRAFVPAVDVSEDDDQFVVTVELPGTTRDDVTVEVVDRTLVIRGEKRSEREEEKEHRRTVERSYGTFSRSFSLPANANGDKIAAHFKDGVLTVTVAKAEEAKPRTVAIKS